MYRAVAFALACGIAAPALAATYTVTSTTDDASGTVAGTLSWAIAQANAGSGDAIVIDGSVTSITVSGTLPALTQTATLATAGNVQIVGSSLSTSGSGNWVLASGSQMTAEVGAAGLDSTTWTPPAAGTGGVGGSVVSGTGFSITNNGTLTGGGGGRGSNNTASDDTYAIGAPGRTGGVGGSAVSGSGFTLTNAGTIVGGVGGDGGHASNGTTNPGSGGNGGAGGAGVSGSGFTLVNTGSITGGAGGAGGAGGTSPSAGAAGAVGAGGVGVASTGGSIVYNSGSIAGAAGADAVAFSGGGNTLVIEAGATFTGNVVSTSGTTGGGDTLALGGTADASFDVSAIGASGTYQGFNNFEKTGTSTWTLTGTSTDLGGWTVAGGTLAVDGTLAGAATVASGGTLGGTGTLGGITVQSGGTLAPGHSIGTLAVSGNLVFESGSTYLVEADAAGNADRVNVDGSITINGGTVDVQAGNGNYAADTTYTILSSTGATTGSFSSVTSNLAFLTASLTYRADGVDLTLERNASSYASAAQTDNQRQVAAYLDGAGSGAAVLQQINTLSEAQARTAFDGLSGSAHAAATQIAYLADRAFAHAVLAHAAQADGASASAGSLAGLGGLQLAGLDARGGSASDAPALLAQLAGGPEQPAAGTRRGAWGQILGGGGRADSDGNGPGSDYDLAGLLLGYDDAIDDRWRAGAAFGYHRADWDADGNGASGSGRIRTPLAMLYARYGDGPWQVRLDAGYAAPTFSTDRTAVFGSAAQTLSSRHHGREWSAAAEAEYALADVGAWAVRPLAGLRYAHLSENGFGETGGDAALAVDGRSSSNTELSAGARFLRPFADGKGGLELRAALSHLFGDADTPITARLLGQPGSFTAGGTPLERDALSLSAGVGSRLARGVGGFLRVAGEVRDHGQNAYAASAGLRVTW